VALLDDYPFVRMLLAVLLLLLAAAFSLFVFVELGQDLALWLFGERVEATVVDRWVQPLGEDGDGELDFRYYVQYRFATAAGQIFTRTATVGALEWAGGGYAGSSKARVDFYDQEAVGPAAPVYQEQKHLIEFGGGALAVEEQVPVVYFRLYPQHNRLDQSRFIPAFACAYVPLVAAAVGALVAAWRLLRSHPAGSGA
jgi:hypothetical protein